jgi:molecular chaperone DnaJ
MADKRDYYEILGVDRSASDGQISEAYRKLAMQYHPDRNPGDEEAVANFKEAAEAFEVLSNADKRARYDRFGHAGLEGVAGGAPQFHDVGDIFAAFGDIFGDFFGGGARGRRVRRGAHIRSQVNLDLFEAAHGCVKTIQFQRHHRCETCGGTGAKPGTKPEFCPYCGGKGHVVQSTGIFSMQTTCPSCHGEGTIIHDPCPSCRGSGYTLRKVTRKVNVPAGVDDQTQLRLQGEGEPSPDGGPPGDCYCVIRVSKHPLFERQGQHLICQVPLSYSQAALGADIEVPTLDGREPLKIKPGTQNGDVYTLGGRGMPDPRHRGHGDLLVQVHVEVPRKLAPEHEEALRKLAEIEKVHVSPKRKSFFEQLKDYFRPA